MTTICCADCYETRPNDMFDVAFIYGGVGLCPDHYAFRRDADLDANARISRAHERTQQAITETAKLLADYGTKP